MCVAFLSFFTEWATPLSLALAILTLIMLLDKLGKGIVLREIVAFLYVLSCLVMPLLGYAYYTSANPLAKLWDKWMPVPYDTYFAYNLPAVSFFCVALLLPFSASKDNEQGAMLRQLIHSIKRTLAGRRNGGLAMLVVGVITSFLNTHLPQELQFFGVLIFFGSFAGFLYVYYSPGFRFKRLIMLSYVSFISLNAINGGMFTIVAYMGITIASFLMIGRKNSLIRKLGIFALAIVFFVVLQNVKLSYRNYIWRSSYEGNKLSLFGQLFLTDLQKGGGLFKANTFFPIYVSTNQGFNIAMVMRRIPAIRPFDNGNNLVKNFASALVPRFLWPDKPMAGGAYNMQYYTGLVVVGWSTNVGPLGEAYGSFGVVGGIVYMFFLGLFIRLVYGKVFNIAKKLPLLVCWLPVIFYQVISSAETDSLTVFNALIKSCFFVWLIYKVFPNLFGIYRTERRLTIKRDEISIPR